MSVEGHLPEAWCPEALNLAVEVMISSEKGKDFFLTQEFTAKSLNLKSLSNL